MGGVIRRPTGVKNTNLNVDRKNPGGYTTKDIERMNVDRKNPDGYTAREKERMNVDRKNPGGNPKPSPSPSPKPVAPPAAPPVVTPVISPTVAEVSQSEAANADSYDLRKTKRKGRSATIMTGPTGVKNEDLVLGKKSLLGL